MENKDTDRFKEAFRAKLSDIEQSTDRDSKVWEKVKAEIQQTETNVYKINHWWIAVAASLTLLLTVSISFLLKTNDSDFISTHKDLSKDKILNDPAADPSNDNGQIAENNNVKEDENATAPISTVEDRFAKGVIYRTDDKVNMHTLTDGSVISINRGSEVKVDPMFKDQRNILLAEGEAFFEVTSDKEKPFTVFFSDYKLVVVGTKFNIRNVENTKEITVVEGIVRVYDNVQQEGVLVKKGEQLVIGKGAPSILTSIEAAENYISWKTGNLEFNKSSLEEVATILSRNYEVEIVLAPQLKKCKFTGDLSGLTKEEALEVIRLSNSVKIENRENKIHITGPNCD